MYSEIPTIQYQEICFGGAGERMPEDHNQNAVNHARVGFSCVACFSFIIWSVREQRDLVDKAVRGLKVTETKGIADHGLMKMVLQ